MFPGIASIGTSVEIPHNQDGKDADGSVGDIGRGEPGSIRWPLAFARGSDGRRGAKSNPAGCTCYPYGVGSLNFSSSNSKL